MLEEKETPIFFPTHLVHPLRVLYDVVLPGGLEVAELAEVVLDVLVHRLDVVGHVGATRGAVLAPE